MTMSNPVRVRFAPSPTGFLHIGGARTALFNWLFARAKGGQFLLRIEDTDRERSETRFTEDILASLTWLGLNWDEAPVYQSQRFPRYKEVVEKLISDGKAYRCDCTQAELDAIRAQCEKEKRAFRYPGTCREKKTVKDPHVVRIKVPREGETGFTDLIRGQITFQNKDLDDWVISRSDGSPTYNFCVVIDDSDQKITHILRGDDHINNTPKQMLLYQALGLAVPNFAHLPMILGPDKTKLSKRHGAASTLEYRAMGYLPEAIICFLARLGWSHGDQEIFTVDELKQYFSLEKIGKTNAVFNPEKLNWVSGKILSEFPAAKLAAYVKQHFSQSIAFAKDVNPAHFERGIQIIQAKVKNVLELLDQLECLFGPDPKDYDMTKLKDGDAAKYYELLNAVIPTLEKSDFTHPDMEAKVRALATEMNLKLSPFAQALRWAVTGGRISPGLFEMLEVQGRATATRRIRNALAALQPVAVK